jgi:hypothetical protein
MTIAELRDARVIDLVRAEPAVILELANFGISPRYLDWTLRDATDDLGISLDRVVSRVYPIVDPPPPAGLAANAKV